MIAVNPPSTSRYRERHSTSREVRPGDALVLAELARTDAQNHRPVAGDTDLAEAVKVLGCAHQSLIWTRRRQASQLRSTLREFYPAALDAFDDLASGDALAVLAIAPTPARGRALFRSKIARSLQDWGGSWARGCSRVRGRPDRFHDTKSRKNYAGTSPITRASGKHRVVGILDGCLTHNMQYDEHTAWSHRSAAAA